jgi:hypothetical protein
MVSLKYNNVEIDFGTGSDGALTVNAANSPYIITTNKNFTNVTVAAGGVLVISRPINATFNGTITANSTTLTVASGSVTGTITAGDELSGGAVKLGTTIASGSGLNWTLSQNQFSTIPSGGVFVSSLQSIGPMPLVKISGTLTVSPASGATAAGIIRGDYQDDVTLPFVNSGSGVEFIRNSAAYDGYNNVYFKSGTAQQWPGAWFGRHGGFNNPDNSIFSHQEEYIAGSGWRNQDRYGGDYGRNPAGGGGGAGYSSGTGGQNAVNDGGSQPGGAGGYQNPNNPRPSSVSLTNYYDNISILYDGHRGGNAGDSSTSRGRGGRSLRIIARYIINNGLITANGENAVSVGRGGGGGGGAGTVVVFCETENGSGTYEAKGGSGGTGDGSWPAGFGGQGGGGTIHRFVGVTYFTGTINTTGTSSVTGTTTGSQALNGLTYVPDNPIVQIEASATGTSTAATGSLTFSHTVGTGSNRLLIVNVTTGGNYVSATNYVKFGTQYLTYLDGGYVNTAGTTGSSTYNKTKFRSELWYLLNPSSGTGTVEISTASGLWIVGASASFTGINQSTPFTSFSSNQSISGSTSAIARSFSTITTDLIYSIVTFPLSNNATLGTSQIDTPHGINVNANNGTNYLHVQGSYKFASAVNSEMAYTLASSQPWVINNVSIKVSSDSSDLTIPTATTLSACPSASNATYVSNSIWSKGSVINIYGNLIKIGASSGATVTTVGNVMFKCNTFDLNGSTVDGNGGGWYGGPSGGYYYAWPQNGGGEPAVAGGTYILDSNQNKYGVLTSVTNNNYRWSTIRQAGIGGASSITGAYGKGGGGGANRGWGGVGGVRSDNSSNGGMPGGGGQSIVGSWGTTNLPYVLFTGGSLTTYTNSGVTYNVVTFTSSGYFFVNNTISVDILMTGGGGGGGKTIGGGGGGAEVKTFTNQSFSGSYTITSGAAGVGATGGAASAYTGGTSGGTTSVVGSGFSQNALGGGGGGGYNVNATGSVGANGGGYAAGGGAPIAAGSGFYSGGTTGSNSNNGAGGGGAGGAGGNAISGTSGAGGAGVASSITGTTLYYGGGGGGGSRSGYGAGASGNGGGGNGGDGNYQTTACDGGTGVRGGGGGAGGFNNGGNYSGTAGSGSPGTVIIRWNAALTSGLDPNYPNLGSFTYLTAGGGGGGGGGTENYSSHGQLYGTAGGAGGGVIWVDAFMNFTGSGTIRCNGVNGTSNGTGGGAGAGGAGGYVLITTKTFSSSGTFTANGGNGGSDTTTSDSSGGGGGGGGVVLIYYKYKPGSPTLTATKGLKGNSSSGTIAAQDGDDGLATLNAVSGYWRYDSGGAVIWF